MYRGYLSQLESAIARVREGLRPPGLTGFQAVIKGEDTSDAKLSEQIAVAEAQRVACESLGLDYVTGFRTSELFTHPANVCEIAAWRQSAKVLRALGDAGFTRVALDVEAYGLDVGKVPSISTLKAFGRTPQQLGDAMMPLLAEIGAAGSALHVFVYPAKPEDLVMQAIALAASTVELWLEDFGLASLAMKDPHAADHKALESAHARAELLALFPAAVVRSGDTDVLLRSLGAEARERRRIDYGPYDPWVFAKNRIGEEQFGSPEWMSISRLGVANDPAHAWAWASATRELREARIGPIGFSAQRTGLPSAVRADAISTKGYMLRDGVFLRSAAKVLPPSDNFTAVWRGVRAGDGPVFGASQPNQDSWAIWVRGEALVLRLRHLSTAQTMDHVVGRADAGAVVVARRGTVYEVTTESGTEYVSPLFPVRPHNGYVSIGAAGTPASASSWVVNDGLVVGAVEVFHRAVTADEAKAIVGDAYPRGVA